MLHERKDLAQPWCGSWLLVERALVAFLVAESGAFSGCYTLPLKDGFVAYEAV